MRVDTSFAVTPRWMVVDRGSVLERPSAVIVDGRVARILPPGEPAPVPVDPLFDDTLLHPGFVNAHAHLDLTWAEGLLTPGADFVDWIRELIALRRVTPLSTIVASVDAGIARMIATGTTTVGDICGAGCAGQRLMAAGMRGVVFHEALGYLPGVKDEALASLIGRVDASPTTALVKNGVSPHAVYSTSAALMNAVARFAHGRKLPVAIHLAETPEEGRFSRHGDGPLARFHEEMGIAVPGGHPKMGPVEMAASVQALRKALAIHVNHPTAEEVDLLVGAEATVVWCPGSNLWFGREAPHPVRTLLQAGVAVALGTDSLASNVSLDMGREMRLAVDAHGFSGGEAFDMATEAGAVALGLPEGCGTLSEGAPFDAVALGPPPGESLDADRVWDYIMAEDRVVDAVFINGVKRYGKAGE